MSLLERALNRTPDKLNIRGRIKTGCIALDANCPICKKAVKAISQVPGVYACPTCGAVCVVIEGKEPGPVSVDYFMLPVDIKGLFPDKPQSIQVIPAYREIESMCVIAYKKKGKGGKVVCESKDGNTAKKKEFKERGKPVESIVPCLETCADRSVGRCKEEAVFSFILPDVDVFSVYLFSTTSDISKTNILSALKSMIGQDGLIARTVCDLELHQAKGASGVYNIFQLNLPRVKLADHEEFRKRRSDFALGWSGSSDISPNTAGSDGLDCRDINVTGVSESDGVEDNPGLSRLVRERNLEFLKSPYADQALELFACKRFSVNNFDDLTKENLLELYKGLGDAGEMSSQIYMIAVQLRSGVNGELPLQPTGQVSTLSGEGKTGSENQAALQQPGSIEPVGDLPCNERVLNGRGKVLEKLKQYVDAPNAEAVFKEYVMTNYGKSFEELLVEDLLKLWHGIGHGSDVVQEVVRISSTTH